MGACTFMVTATGSNAKEAFKEAVEEATYDYGHRGYTGSIAEKDAFVIITCPPDQNPHDYAEALIDNGDGRVDDKWGPAGCINLGENKYLFFGWASS